MLMHEKTCVIPIVVYRFYCMALFHSMTRRHMINIIDMVIFDDHSNIIAAALGLETLLPSKISG